MRLTLIDQVDIQKLTLKELISKGLTAAPQGPKKLSGDLLKYIESNFTDLRQKDIFPEMLSEMEYSYEGIRREVTVNKYERSSIARAKCIEYHGSRCTVCGLNFVDLYGNLGYGFIHIHHVIPISQVGSRYKVDYKKDLVPVCPNCHAMLHRTNEEGKETSIEELRSIIKNRNGT